MIDKLKKITERMSKYKAIVLSLAVVVVFITTYLLILPAFTLEKEKAEEQGGIDVPVTAVEAETDQDTSDADIGSESDDVEERSEPAKEKNALDGSKETDAAKASREDSADLLSFESDDFNIFISDNNRVLPDDVRVDVTEIDKKEDAKEYKQYCKEALTAINNEEGVDKLQDIGFIHLYDISLKTGDKEIEPEGGDTVNVKVEYSEDFRKSLKIDDPDKIKIVHFTEDEETGKLKAEVLNVDDNSVQVDTDKKDRLESAEFEAGSFSVYAVVYTVDFIWEVDGETLEYSLEGGSFISVKTLVEELRIADDSESFVLNIESAEFSDPDLVWVEKVEKDTTVGALKEARELDCQYSDELTDEQIEEINGQSVAAGDWALISLKPFETEESLTITMKNGEVFVIKVTDAQYDGTVIPATNLNGATGALINLANNNALLDVAQSGDHLRATGISVSGNSITSNDNLTEWTFTRVSGTQDQYYIGSSNGYLHIGSSGGLSISSQQQALQVQTKSNGTIRIKHPNNNNAVNNTENNTSNGYGTYGSDWDANPGEWFTVYSITPPVVHHVTVHYVDRNGKVLTGVQYTGGNSAVVDNGDGTFTIPYNISGNVDLRANFKFDSVSKEGSSPAKYTYANTHLAGDGGDGDGRNLTYEGMLIDSNLKASNGSLSISTDSGETWPDDATHNDWHYNNDTLRRGNRNYGTLVDYSLSNTIYARSFMGPNSTAPKVYSEAEDKDIYVVLDPLPGENASSPSGGGNLDADPPELTKTMVPNEDGTYTLKLTVDAHGKNVSETNKANIIFIVDTSSSMRSTTTSNSRNRIMDTHDAAKAFGQDLLAYNTPDHPDAVQLSMVTFDGSVIDRLSWTTSSSTFTTAVDEYLRYYYLHQGTDWEDSLKRALEMVNNPPDDDPTFVVFFTDGEPSQYTNFHGAQTNPNADPTNQSNPAEQLTTNYPNFYSYFLCREGSKDEMRAIVDSGAQLYAIYAYNSTTDGYNGYNGREDGALMLHNALKYGYNTTASLEGNLFYEAKNTTALQNAFDKIYNLITEKVGFSNVVVKDGIAAGVTSTSVLDGDVSAFTYTIKDDKGQLAYQVTVAPNGVPEGTTPAPATGTPIFKLRDGTVHVGEIRSVPTTKISGNSSDNTIQTETVNVPVYYYKDGNDNEYIMPISTTGENISWDLAPLGLLKDGYSYEVSFVVWPNQESYDLVADLNNGKRPDIESTANWQNCPVKTDSSGKQYRQGGFPGYPYISRYEDTGVYAAMSNTDQSVDYYKVDEKIVNGQEHPTITGKVTETVPPPDPMPLEASLSRVEKLWNVERDPLILAQYLYKSNGSSKEFRLRFDVFQGDNLTDPYKSVYLGWDPDANNGQGAYIWAPEDTMTNVTYAGYPHQIGQRWVTEFSIATGLMLTTGEMERLGLNKDLYPSAELDGETYYILEPGHDYTIKENGGNIGYEFDFFSPVYHPMIVDGVLKSVEIQYTYKTDETGQKVIDTATLTSITDNEVGLTGLEVQNTLRGYINLNKIVVDEEGERVESDNTKFEYDITLESSTDPGPFEGDHIPWYGINGLFYNDGHENYYQVYETQDHVWVIRNEEGKEYPVISTGFDPDEAGKQTVNYEVYGEPKEIVLYGNQMFATEDGKTATATLAITQNETLYIANVPVGTQYTIIENPIDEYELVDILKEVKNGNEVESSEHVAETDIGSREASGTIVTNRDNHVTYTNRIRTGKLEITKTIQKNSSTDTSATGRFYYAVYDEQYDASADPAQTPVRKGYIDVTENGTATVTEDDLKMGNYYVYELTGENGTPVTSGGIFNGGKYYSVTTTGSPATVEEDGTSTAGIVNNYETIPVTATKSWADNNPQQLTIYFKLFYRNAAGVAITTATPLKELPYNVTSVTWDDMPKYDENGNAYEYIVREYILDDTNGEFEEGGHKYTEAAPNGYVNTEAGLTVTNSKIETYEPVTTYSGLKVWVDTVNGNMTRPDGLTVTLMMDKSPYDDPAGDVPVVDDNGDSITPDWVTVGDNWRYSFSKLPMFDENMQIIRYYAVETPVDGYIASTTEQNPTQYVYLSSTLDHTENDAYPQMSSDADLVYTAVRIQHEGYLHHIWTQRVPTAEEKTRLVELVNQDLSSRGLADPPATVDNVRWVSGLPINHEFVWKAQPNGYKVSFTRESTDTIHVKVDNHGAFSNICYGTLKYNYSAGSTSFRNELEPVTYSVEKTWGDGIDPPADSVVVVELKAAVTRPVDPQPADADETVYETLPVEHLTSLGITQITQVVLNGGAEGGDDTASDPWKYTWSDLPQYDKYGNEITYSVIELSYIIGGHTVNLKDFAPTVDTSTPGTTKLTNQIPSFSFDILKISQTTAETLPGARFVIRQIAPTSEVSDPTVVGNDSSSVPATTDENGRVSFNDIPLGYYEVEETELPLGYIFINNENKFYLRVDTYDVILLEKVVSADGKLTFREVPPGAGGRIILGNIELTKTGKILFTVENTPGPELPQSGGIGTTIFYVLGSILVICGLIYFIARKRAA